MKKNLTIFFAVGLIIFVFGWYIVGNQKLDSVAKESVEILFNEDSVSTATLIGIRQYQSEEEALTVWEYETEVYAIGAGLDRVTLARVPESPTAYFSNQVFALAFFDDEVRVWRDDIPHYEGQEKYNEESWELMIPATCQHYFDGCNTCSLGGGCTKMSCMAYDKPYCLDEV